MTNCVTVAHLRKIIRTEAARRDAKLANIPKTYHDYFGEQIGEPAPGSRVSVDTQIDESQRDIHIPSLLKYIKKSGGINWDLFGYITVVEYPDGRQTVIDGQHRLELVKTFSLVDEVPAHIIQVDDEKYAAKLFAAMNGVQTRNITPEQLFWAQVIAEDPLALDIKATLEAADLSCDRVNAGPNRKNVKYTNFYKCYKMSPAATIRAARLIDLAYPDREMNDLLLSGMTRLLSRSEYEDLMNSKTRLYHHFDEWFLGLGNFLPISQLSFKDLRNCNHWHDGVAYGLYQLFAVYQRKHNRMHPSVKPLKQTYEANSSSRVELEYE